LSPGFYGHHVVFVFSGWTFAAVSDPSDWGVLEEILSDTKSNCQLIIMAWSPHGGCDEMSIQPDFERLFNNYFVGKARGVSVLKPLNEKLFASTLAHTNRLLLAPCFLTL
tara:strand:- start:4397 stop:4726 length:330 start_codon:yes stop_codon:yes gene_type:complete